MSETVTENAARPPLITEAAFCRPRRKKSRPLGRRKLKPNPALRGKKPKPKPKPKPKRPPELVLRADLIPLCKAAGVLIGNVYEAASLGLVKTKRFKGDRRVYFYRDSVTAWMENLLAKRHFRASRRKPLKSLRDQT